MKKNCKTLFLALLCCATAAHSQDTIPGKIDELIGRYAAYNKFNGAALVAVNGKVLLEKGYGLKDVDRQSANDTKTIFPVGSITKEFTAAVILKLAASGHLHLSDRISRYFPGFPKGDSITIEDLLAQTSGLFNYTTVENFWTLSGKPATEQSVMDSIKNKPLLFPPGEKFSYSNSNYMLLAYIIQKVTKQPYESVVRRILFTPAGMAHSGFDFRDINSPDKATGYWTFSPMGYTRAPSLDSTEFIGSGSIYSTVGDLYRWHQVLQQGKLIDKAILELAYSSGKGPYGYGWELDSAYGKKIVGHGGRVWGFEAKMIRIPREDVFIILLNNHSDEPCLDLIGKGILAILYHRPYPLPAAPMQLSATQLKSYTGRFSPDGSRIFETMVVNGHLFGKESSEHPPKELFALGNNRFVVVDHEIESIEVEFGMDENGIAKEVSFTNVRLGRKMTLPKLK